MKRTADSRSNRVAKPVTAAPLPRATHQGFLTELREIILPKNKWHYAFHAVVIAVALFYWIGSRVFQPQASWGETIMYRPAGDNQVWPVVTALSHFNFGDPTDALKYGQGVGGFHAVILLPYAIVYAIFGGAGYMIADAVLAWCYFVAAAMLFRRWQLGALGSLTLSAALATSSLQAIFQKISEAFSKILALFGHTMTEWDVPAIFSLSMAGKRIPRPFPTEIFLVLILYFLVRQWRESRMPSFKRGLALGVLMGLLMQGDPFSFVALGLLSIAVIARTMRQQNGKVPARFVGGAFAGVALVGWYFVVQMLGENPDSAARFGLANYPRSKIFFLPTAGPWLRLAFALLMALLIRALARRVKKRGLESSAAATSARDPDGALATHQSDSAAALALFALAMVAAAWAAQPLQLLLLGKGAQIYHYFLYTLPTFFSYGLILFAICLFRAVDGSARLAESESPTWRGPGIGLACGAALVAMFVLGVQESAVGIKYSGVSRHEATPWSVVGDAFRPNFRALDKAFREIPALKNSRTFATFCQEVNFLLVSFHGKHAFLPDNAFTTLSDKELEQRLFETSKICRMSPETFANMIQDWYTMNFWLGCAKYWCASDYKFGRDEDYPPNYLEAIRKMPPESAFNLVLPKSEFQRITTAYEATLSRPSDASTYPDTVVLSFILKSHGIDIDPTLYREAYTNDVFTVYTKIPKN